MNNEELLTPILLQIMQTAWKLTDESPAHTTNSKDILKTMQEMFGTSSGYSALNKNLSILVKKGFLYRKVGCGDNPGTAAWKYSIGVTKKEYYTHSNRVYLKKLYIGIPMNDAVKQFIQDAQCG